MKNVILNEASSNEGNQKPGEVFDELQTMNLKQLSSYLDTEMRTLSVSKMDLDRKRDKGAHKFTGALQDSMVAFHDFLETFSGIVDIVSAADSQFGGVACATLSLLFVVGIEDDIHPL